MWVGLNWMWPLEQPVLEWEARGSRNFQRIALDIWSETGGGSSASIVPISSGQMKGGQGSTSWSLALRAEPLASSMIGVDRPLAWFNPEISTGKRFSTDRNIFIPAALPLPWAHRQQRWRRRPWRPQRRPAAQSLMISIIERNFGHLRMPRGSRNRWWRMSTSSSHRGGYERHFGH